MWEKCCYTVDSVAKLGKSFFRRRNDREEVGRFNFFKTKTFSAFSLDDGKHILYVIQNQYFIYNAPPNFYKHQKNSAGEV